MESALRITLSLTQDDQGWCQLFAENEMLLPLLMRVMLKSHKHRSLATNTTRHVGIEDESDARILDELCLGLGVLTNLIQTLSTMKSQLRDFFINVNCVGRRGCIVSCECSDRISAFECLGQMYAQLSKNDIDPGSGFLRGHLAVVFGLLMIDNPKNQTELLAVLPGPTKHDRLSDVVQQAAEFVGFYDRLTARLNVAEGQFEKADEETLVINPNSRMAVIASTQGNGNVAQEIVVFLRRLFADPCL